MFFLFKEAIAVVIFFFFASFFFFFDSVDNVRKILHAFAL